MEAVFHACQLIALIAVEELVFRVGALLGHHGLEAVEIAFLRTETGVEVHPVRIDIIGHHSLEIRDKPVQFPGRHVDKLHRQHLGLQKDIALLVDVPVKTRHIHLVVASRLYKERLAVVLNLQHHHGGVVGVGFQLKGAVGVDGGMVHHHFGAGEHVGVAVEEYLLPCPIDYLAVDGDIGLCGHRSGACH